MNRKEWEDLLSVDYKSRGRRKPVYYSDSKIALDDLYDQENLARAGFDPERDLGFPG